jgi:enamine deaminase RidA (YjgF/YER057c/UK114 family)
MQKEYFPGTWQQSRAFSPMVATNGGRMLWVAGHGATHDANGKPLDGDFDGQVRQSFANLSATLARAGGKLQDIVTMTVFIIDARYGDRFIEMRKAYFPEGFPASALITVAGFARPSMMVEIQCVAVAPE